MSQNCDISSKLAAFIGQDGSIQRVKQAGQKGALYRVRVSIRVNGM